MTLRWRLTLFYTVLLAALLTAVAVAVLLIMRSSLMSDLDRDLQDTYRRFTDIVSQLALNDPGTAQERDQAGLLPRVRYLFPDDAIQIEDLSFFNDAQALAMALESARTPAERENLLRFLRTLSQSTRLSIGLDRQAPLQLSDAELIRLITSPAGQIIIRRDVKDPYSNRKTPYRVLVKLGPVQLTPPVLGVTRPSFALTYVGRSLEPVMYTLSQLQQVILVLLLLGLIASGVGAYLLAGQALRPLRQVQRAAERIGGQNLGERVPEPQTGDEVQALAHALNAMLSRLEASFEAQRRFTSDASHELRTPVTAISGHASYLLRRTDPTEGQRESLNIIRRESERLTNLIASLLQLARSDSGALVLTRQPILSGLFLAEIARELLPLAQAQGTELVAQGQDVAFEGDPDRLKQVIINLVGNALKAGARHVTLGSQPAEGGREVRLWVQDDGPGIPSEHLARLFDRFYRVEDSRSRDQGGAGLGLSIAKGIVDAHGGRIWLESEVGRGTTAYVQLPVGNVPELEEDVP
ncbi:MULTISPECIES: sensor histidine kinase [Deinococcus]|uniref:histidine kinase n=1 Tax=Deinococcus geothermalis (strain DSM 11300 / CIP 105573 / AG-3a) TaxID=319795 RepID=Q1IVX5_DEIGD|nr:HAMP domain-containing sensor histidine kinase [Deinococcus geothermalis]ABF46609.1 periplasmic sensor signal transduction histidine kinase [Deinococcus geothermalis DSM 11300]